MYAFTNWIYSGRKLFEFFVKKINLDLIIQKAIVFIFIAVLMYFSIKIGNKLINKFVDKQVQSKMAFSLDPQKAITIGGVLKSILKYSVYIIGIATMLYDILTKIPVALVSVGGFAIGIGAQSLVKDIINGFFILFEDQYGIGDHVTIGKFQGIVESIGIRTTNLRDFTGDLHLIPNGSVLEVTNHSRGNIRFIVDVEIAFEENIDETIELIKKVNKKFQEKHADKIRGDIKVLGVNSLNSSGVTIRVIGMAVPLSQWEMERELRKEIKIELDNVGIEIPYPKTKIIKID